MTIQVEQFSPDSCACSMEISYDDTLSNPPFSLVQFLNKCPFHAIVSDQSAFNAIFDEDLRKSVFIQGMINNFPLLFSDSGAAFGGLKDNIAFTTTLIGAVPNRVLNVNFVKSTISLTQTQLRNAQTWCDNNIGVGKVVITNS